MSRKSYLIPEVGPNLAGVSYSWNHFYGDFVEVYDLPAKILSFGDSKKIEKDKKDVCGNNLDEKNAPLLTWINWQTFDKMS